MHKWNGRPPKLDADETKALREIAAKRAEIPSNAQLARKYGVSRSTIANYLGGRLKQRPV